MNKVRPETPGQVARQLRQEAGFGCCKCGHPIFEYHHIIPYALEPHFRLEDMMILCPNCHDETKKGVMTEREQRHYKSHPYNLQHGYAKGWLVSKTEVISVMMGSNVFIGEGAKVQINGESLISLHINEFGCLEITSTLYDKSDQKIFVIKDNEWLSGNPAPWDIDADYQVITIREKLRQISFSLDLRKTPAELRADFWRNGFQISVLPKELLVNQISPMTITGSTFTNCGIAIQTMPRLRVKVGSRM